MKRIIIFLMSVLVFSFLITGCGSGKEGSDNNGKTPHIGSNGTNDGSDFEGMSVAKNGDVTYTYKNPYQTDDFIITKSVYSDNSLKIYIEIEEPVINKDIYRVMLYDSDLNYIDDCEKYSYKNDVLIIKDKHPNHISGVEVLFESQFGVKLRYLDSNQFAGLSVVFVDDLGFVDWGDEDAYYSAAEKQAQKDSEEAAQKANKEAIYMMSGHWVEKDGETYVDIYDADGYVEMLFHVMENGKEVDDYQLYVDFFRYHYDEDEDVYYISGSQGEMMADLHFELSENKTVLKFEYEDKPFIKQ